MTICVAGTKGTAIGPPGPRNHGELVSLAIGKDRRGGNSWRGHQRRIDLASGNGLLDASPIDLEEAHHIPTWEATLTPTSL